jgi:hypothetical protein
MSRTIIRQGYWWPTMLKDCTTHARSCSQCQRHAHLLHQPGTHLVPTTEPLPFARWGIDILGPFPKAAGQRTHLIVAVDYFSKWVEAEPLASLTTQKAWNFLWRSVITRYGILRVLVADNGTQFDSLFFKERCRELGIALHFTSVAHPQANGQAEVTNRTILHGLKTRLTPARGAWADELPSVLWSYRTTPRAPTGSTPFSLVYGAEAVIPAEVGEPSLRVQLYEPTTNEQELTANINLADLLREAAAIKSAKYARQMERACGRRGGRGGLRRPPPLTRWSSLLIGDGNGCERCDRQGL